MDMTNCPVDDTQTAVSDFERFVGMVGTGFWKAPVILQQLKDGVTSKILKVTLTYSSRKCTAWHDVLFRPHTEEVGSNISISVVKVWGNSGLTH